MKILKKYIDRKRKGMITVIPEEEEDFWFLFNIIKVGDRVKMKVSRKVQNSTNITGLVKNSKRYVLALLEVLDVNFSYDNNGTSLFLKTKNIAENQYIELGAMQSAELVLYYPISIYKSNWDNITLGYLNDSKQFAKTSDIAAMLIENGSANTFYIKNNFSVHNSKIEKSLPRKKTNLMPFYNKALDEFYARCMDSIINAFPIDEIKCFVIAGPGTTPDNFLNFLKEKAELKEFKIIKQNLSKFFVVHASSTTGNALNEILEDKAVQNMIVDTRSLKESQMLGKFFDTIRIDPGRAVYGEREIFYAQDMAAIEHLLIIDSMFRSHDFKLRKKFIKLTEDVKSTGGAVHILSDMHPSGRKLKDITGIAGILRFPINLDILDQINEQDEEDAKNIERIENGEEEEEESNDDNLMDVDNEEFDEYMLFAEQNQKD